MAKNMNMTVTIILMLLVLGGIFGVYWFFIRDVQQPVLSIEGYYDADGNRITAASKLFQQATIAEAGETTQFRVKFIKLNVAAINTIDVPLEFSLTGISPTAFETAIDVGGYGAFPYKQTATAGSSVTWTSDFIDVEQFTALSQPVTFTVSVNGVNQDKTPISAKLGTLVLTITSDALVDFDVTLDKQFQDY